MDSCVCRGHGNRECGVSAVKEALGLKRDGLLQGYTGLEVIAAGMREKRHKSGCVQKLPQATEEGQGGNTRFCLD